jgi:hypothetical protein
VTQPQQDRASKGALIAGYVFAVLMPFVGLIVGIVVMFKRRLGHGIAIVALSTLVFGVVLSLALSETADELDREADRIEQKYDRDVEQYNREVEKAEQETQREYDEMVDRANREAAEAEKAARKYDECMAEAISSGTDGTECLDF